MAIRLRLAAGDSGGLLNPQLGGGSVEGSQNLQDLPGRWPAAGVRNWEESRKVPWNLCTAVLSQP